MRALRFGFVALALLALQMLLVPLASAAQQASPQQELENRFEDAYDRKDWRTVLSLGEKLESAAPRRSRVAYNIACAHAQLGALDLAVGWLQKSADRGFQGITLLDTDPSLDPIRGRPEFASARATIEKRRAENFEKFREAASRTAPLVFLPEGLDARDVRIIIVALHGFGGNGKEMAAVWQATAKKHHAVVIAPDALRPAGQGFSWTFLDEGEWWTLEALRRIREELHLESVPVILTGFSQGANLALRLGARHPETFAGVIAVAGHYDPSLMAAPKSKPAPCFYLLTGDEDPQVATFRAAERDFRKARVRVKLQVFSGGHQFPQPPEPALTDALNFVLSVPSR